MPLGFTLPPVLGLSRTTRRVRLRNLSRALHIAHSVENPEITKQVWAYGNSLIQ